MEKDENYCHKAAICKNYQPYVCDELCSFDLNTSWFNGKYDIGDWTVTVNTSQSFISFEAKPDSPCSDFTFQGDEADSVIQGVYEIWQMEDMTNGDAIAQWANLYLY